jgi:hypothetical protein
MDKCKECSKQWSCNYLNHRFNIKECDINKTLLVNMRYTTEFINREILLKGLSL